jgi:UDPglucose 6-dehydrogenase
MRKPILIDGRNIYEPAEMKALGFQYRGIGRGYTGAGAAAKEKAGKESAA